MGYGRDVDMLPGEDIRKKLLLNGATCFVRLPRRKRNCFGSKAISKAKRRNGGRRRPWFGCLIV